MLRSEKTELTSVECVHYDDITSWLPSLQLSVFVFLRVVVASLRLLGQLPAVFILVFLVSSALRVRWPEGGL